MRELNKEEMKTVNGGVSVAAIVSIMVGAITFIVGALEGYTNPKKCNN